MISHSRRWNASPPISVGYSDGARPRNADELHELVRAHGTMRVATLEQLPGGEASALALGIEEAGRLMRVQVASEAPESVIVADYAALFAAAYPDAVFLSSQSGVGIPASPADVQISQADARTEILRRALATTVPTTVLDLAARLALTPNEIEGILAALEANGVVFRGYFTVATPNRGTLRFGIAARSITNGAASKSASRAPFEQWCDRYVLERIHRQTLLIVCGPKSNLAPTPNSQRSGCIGLLSVGIRSSRRARGGTRSARNSSPGWPSIQRLQKQATLHSCSVAPS